MKLKPNRKLGDFFETKSGNYETNEKILNKELTTVFYEEIITQTQRKSQNLIRVRYGRETDTRTIPGAKKRERRSQELEVRTGA